MTATHLVERAGVTVVLGESPAPPDELLAGLPVEPGFRHVVVAVHPGPTGEELAQLLRGRTDGIRLLLSYAAANGIARTLADDLGVTVVAPTGPALMLPEALFVQDGEWVLFRSGQEPVAQGARFPAPRWQPLLRHGPGLTPIPAGLWLHPPGEPMPSDLLTLPVVDERVTVVVGAVPPVQARAALRTLPWTLRHDMLLEPYGLDAHVVDEIGRGLSEGLLPTRAVNEPSPDAHELVEAGQLPDGAEPSPNAVPGPPGAFLVDWSAPSGGWVQGKVYAGVQALGMGRPARTGPLVVVWARTFAASKLAPPRTRFLASVVTAETVLVQEVPPGAPVVADHAADKALWRLADAWRRTRS